MLKHLSHFNVRTKLHKETRDFYCDVLGLSEGYRPTFPFDGYWLYCGTVDVLHITSVKDDDAGLKGYLGDKEITAGGGSIDHIAFTATNAVEMGKKFDTLGLKTRHRKVPNMDLYQIFIDDPNGITIELNFFNEHPKEWGQ